MALTGCVYKSTGSWYHVKLEDGSFADCRLKGKFRTKGIKATNPVAVGDLVNIKKQANGDYVIHGIEPRKNYLIRRSTKLSKQFHLIATNIDQILLVATVDQPYTSYEFIDRITITAMAYNIPLKIVFNKIDLFKSGRGKNKLDEYAEVYESIGYKVICTSVKSGENLEQVKAQLQDKLTLITGHSGVGKSSVINELDPEVNLKTGDISELHQTGRHTTTFAEIHDLSFGAQIIDTPGLRAFGIVDFAKEELSHYFVEMRELLNQCKFNNCRHVDEPGCAVKQAVEDGPIPVSRYNSYLNLYEEETTSYRENKYL